MGKKKIIKRFEQLPDDVLEKVREKYPDGFEDYLISFTNPKGEIEFGLPYDTEDVSYLIKMPKTTVSDDEEDFDSATTFGGFDNFENLDIADEVEEDEEE